MQAFQPRTDAGRKLDILIARENSGGIYQGSWQDEDDTSGNRLAGTISPTPTHRCAASCRPLPVWPRSAAAT